MKARLLLLASALLAINAVAQAADIPRPSYKAPAATFAPALSWAGWYGGVGGGYGWGDPSADVVPGNISPFPFAAITTGTFAPTAPFTLRTRPEGGFAGALAGYNWQFQYVVLGVEADFYWANLRDTDSRGFLNRVTYDTGPGGTSGTASLESELQWYGTVRGRWGYIVGPVLPYITGGLAYGRVKSTVSTSGAHFDSTPTFVGFGSSATFSDWLLGYSVGAGLDWVLANNWLLRAEYLYISLQGGDHTVTGVAGVSTLSNELDAHFARFAIVYRIP